MWAPAENTLYVAQPQNQETHLARSGQAHKNTSIFAKPLWPILISVLSLLVSVASLWNGYLNNSRTNKRIDAVYEPRFDVKKGEFQTFAQFDFPPPSERFAGNYEPLVTRDAAVVVKDGVAKTVYRVLSELVFWDEKNKKSVDGTRPMQSVKDTQDEIKRLNIQNPKVAKHMRVIFTLVNLGRLAANNVAVTTEILMAGVSDKHTRPPVPVVHGNKEFALNVDLYKTISEHIDEIKFRISVDFDFDGMRRTSGVKEYTYYATEGRWSGI